MESLRPAFSKCPESNRGRGSTGWVLTSGTPSAGMGWLLTICEPQFLLVYPCDATLEGRSGDEGAQAQPARLGGGIHHSRLFF